MITQDQMKFRVYANFTDPWEELERDREPTPQQKLSQAEPAEFEVLDDDKK